MKIEAGVPKASVARQCREDPATREIAIIAITAFSQEYGQNNALEAGCDAYIVKPINTRTLLQQIETVVATKAQVTLDTRVLQQPVEEVPDTNARIALMPASP